MQKNIHKIVEDIINSKDFSPGLKWGVDTKKAKGAVFPTATLNVIPNHSKTFSFLGLPYIGE